jgi:hypothetical protein
VRVPEPGEKHEQGEGMHLQPPARSDAQWGQVVLVNDLEGAHHQDKRKNGAKKPKIPS